MEEIEAMKRRRRSSEERKQARADEIEAMSAMRKAWLAGVYEPLF